MIKTIIVLIVTLIVVPAFSFYFGAPLTPPHQQILFTCLYIAIGVALVCFAISQITGNCSQVDKIWSIVPIIYVWYIAYAGGWNDRTILMATLVTIWGARLTYNFSRRGAYSWKFWSGEEDYRWAVLRSNPALKGKTRWLLFNLFFISIYQNGLILLFTLPILVALSGANSPLNLLDITIALVFLSFVLLETIADQQQWSYQNEKHRKMKSSKTLEGKYEQGFVSSGLWSKMRHPNYTAEQGIWISFYLLGATANGEWLNWSISGCLLLIILFQGSSDFSESISASKYPSYKDYQSKVGRFIPKLR